MKLHVKYTAQLRTVMQRAEETVELPAASCLADLAKALAEQNPAARTHLLSGRGELNACLLIVVNEMAVAAADAATVELRDGDVILLLPPIAGG